MSIPEVSCWKRWFPCCYDTEVEKEPSKNAVDDKEKSLSNKIYQNVPSYAEQVESANALNNMLRKKRHVKLASTDIMSVQNALNMSDVEYQHYLKRNIPNTPRDSEPLSDPLPTSRYKPQTPTFKA